MAAQLAPVKEVLFVKSLLECLQHFVDRKLGGVRVLCQLQSDPAVYNLLLETRVLVHHVYRFIGIHPLQLVVRHYVGKLCLFLQ